MAHRFQIVLTDEMHQQLINYCDKNDLTMATVVRKFVRLGLLACSDDNLVSITLHKIDGDKELLILT